MEGETYSLHAQGAEKRVLPFSSRFPSADRQPRYAVRFAATVEEKEAAFRLRFEVFNLELREGLASSFLNGQDTDEFDEVCDHLIVEDSSSGRIVGTYRLQTGKVAERFFGYYSAREFDFAPYEAWRSQIVELGRAAVHKDHRSFEVLNLLWRGIAAYARVHQVRYLIGCSSLTSQCPVEGTEAYRMLAGSLADPEFRTKPLPDYVFEMPPSDPSRQTKKLPKLLLAYLAVGAKIASAPAMDREFKTIDFLTILDLENISTAARARFFR